MKISVVGMGYVGCVTGAALSRRGNDVIGIDVNGQKVGAINRGDAPILEKGLSELIADRVRDGKLRATTNGAEAVEETELSLICVGTPARKNGSFDYSHLLSAVREVGEGIKRKHGHHVVAIRSTLLPGTTEHMVIPELEKSPGKKAARTSLCTSIRSSLGKVQRCTISTTSLLSLSAAVKIRTGAYWQKSMRAPVRYFTLA